MSRFTTIAAGHCLDCNKKFRLDKEFYTCLTCNNRCICKSCFYENYPTNGKKLKLKYYNIC